MKVTGQLIKLILAMTMVLSGCESGSKLMRAGGTNFQSHSWMARESERLGLTNANWQEIHGPWQTGLEGLFHASPVSSALVLPTQDKIIYGFTTAVEGIGGWRYASAGIQMYDLKSGGWTQLHDGYTVPGDETKQFFNGNYMQYIVPHRGLKQGAIVNVTDDNHIYALDLSNPLATAWQDLAFSGNVSSEVSQTTSLGSGDLVVGLTNGEVYLYAFDKGVLANPFAGKWVQLHSSTWDIGVRQKITSMVVVANGPATYYLIVGLSYGRIGLYQFKDPLNSLAGGKWNNWLHDSGWRNDVSQLLVLPNGDLVVGLAKPGAVEMLHFVSAPGAEMIQGYWCELHDTGWAQRINTMLFDPKTNDLIVGLGDRSGFRYYDRPTWGAVEKYHFADLTNAEDACRGAWQELHGTGWLSAVTAMVITDNHQLVVGLNNGAVEMYDLEKTPLNPDSAWQELHDPGWLNPISQLQLLNDGINQYLVAGLGIYYDGAWGYYYTTLQGGQIEMLQLPP